jgi:hypothetical protein
LINKSGTTCYFLFEFKAGMSSILPARHADVWTMDYPVDFLCYTPEEFEEKRKEISIVRQALKEGVAI